MFAYSIYPQQRQRACRETDEGTVPAQRRALFSQSRDESCQDSFPGSGCQRTALQIRARQDKYRIGRGRAKQTLIGGEMLEFARLFTRTKYD